MDLNDWGSTDRVIKVRYLEILAQMVLAIIILDFSPSHHISVEWNQNKH